MRFSCAFDYYPAPAEDCQYINPAVIEVYGWGTDGSEQLIAKLAIDHLDLTRAATAGVSIYDVCDSDSSGWEAVYSILLQPGQDFAEPKEELNFDEPIFDLLFLYCSVFHPSMDRWRLFILDHAARLFGESSAMVMWGNETGLASSDLARLGFRRIAGTTLLFRPNMLVNDYSQDSLEQDSREADLFEVDGQLGNEVESEWNRRMGPQAG